MILLKLTRFFGLETRAERVTDPKSKVRIVSKILCGSSTISPLVAIILVDFEYKHSLVQATRRLTSERVVVTPEIWRGYFFPAVRLLPIISVTWSIFGLVQSRGDSLSGEGLRNICANNVTVKANSTITMVKKRVRDPEALAEAPPAAGRDDNSGSDDVGERAPICAQLAC